MTEKLIELHKQAASILNARLIVMTLSSSAKEEILKELFEAYMDVMEQIVNLKNK